MLLQDDFTQVCLNILYLSLPMSMCVRRFCGHVEFLSSNRWPPALTVTTYGIVLINRQRESRWDLGEWDLDADPTQRPIDALPLNRMTRLGDGFVHLSAHCQALKIYVPTTSSETCHVTPIRANQTLLPGRPERAGWKCDKCKEASSISVSNGPRMVLQTGTFWSGISIVQKEILFYRRGRALQ